MMALVVWLWCQGPWCRWPRWWTAALAWRLAMSGLVRLSPGVVGVAAGEPVPDDRYHAIYFAMLLAGVGFLLPYNSFITDVDYLHHKFPGGSPRHTPPSEPVRTLSSGRCPPETPRAGPCSGEPISFRSRLSYELPSDLRDVTHLLWAISPFGV